jgi:hypothetical protein
VITLTGSDADSDPLTYVVSTLPLRGQLFDGPDTSSPAVTAGIQLASATLTYRPNVNYSGSDSFGYKADDGLAQSAEDLVGITITAARHATTTAYTGASNGYIANKTAKITLSGVITSSDPACIVSRLITFTFDKNPVTGAVGSYVVGSSRTNVSGAASVTASTSAWTKPGTYQVVATSAGDTSCAGSASVARPLTLQVQKVKGK